jgi:flagellar biosynthetic protein FlhB
MSETEQNKTEEATPYKLKRSREKGLLARGMDLGFAASLAAFVGFAATQAQSSLNVVALSMARTLASAATATPDQTPRLVFESLSAGVRPITLLLFTAVIVVTFFEIVQNRGIVFSATPLKPDFSRLNPAKGLKRVFSMRMLKETLKSVLKLVIYATSALILVSYALRAIRPADAIEVVSDIERHGMRLLGVFLLIAIGFAALDQILSRGEFRKQMRMSRSEVTRETKDRDGDPRIRQKRKRLHADFTKQVKSLAGLPGADMLIVNPQHFAVALRYKPNAMTAPQVCAKGRNRFALLLKRRAKATSIVIFERPALARALHKACDAGQEIHAAHYRLVADLYRDLRRSQSQEQKVSHADA